MADDDQQQDDGAGTDTDDQDQQQDQPDPAALAAEVEKWKKLSRQNETELRKTQKELEKAKQTGMTDAEKAIADARAEARESAFKEANQRLLKAEVRALAAGVLADPDDAVHLLDLSRYEPDRDGDFDTKAIRADLAALVKSKPYLGARPGNGSGEGGPRGGAGSGDFNGNDWLRDQLAAKR